MSDATREAIEASKRHGARMLWAAVLVLIVPFYAFLMLVTQPAVPAGCESMGPFNPQQVAAATGQVSIPEQVDVICHPELAAAP